MTKSYAQIKAEIARLEKEAAAIRAVETTKVVAHIRESIATFGLSVEQLFGQGAKALQAATSKVMVGSGKAQRKGAGIAKYRDPKTGKTWTGFGKAPGWIAKVRNRDKFLIEQPGVVAVPSVKEATAPEATQVARKARAVPTPARKAIRTRRGAAAAVKVTAVQAPTKKTASKKASAKKGVQSKKSVPSATTASAPKSASLSSAAAKTAKKVISKAVSPQPATKRNSRIKTAVESAVASAAPEGAETAVSAS